MCKKINLSRMKRIVRYKDNRPFKTFYKNNFFNISSIFRRTIYRRRIEDDIRIPVGQRKRGQRKFKKGRLWRGVNDRYIYKVTVGYKWTPEGWYKREFGLALHLINLSYSRGLVSFPLVPPLPLPNPPLPSRS